MPDTLCATRQVIVDVLAIMHLAFPVWVAAAGQAPRATLAITPARPLMDERLTIRISGLPPNGSVTIHARSRAHDQRYWRSEAVFTAGPDGSIDLGTQSPVAGTYRGADAMGLFWSMQPDPEPKSGDAAFFAVADWSVPVVTEFEAACGNQFVGTARLERRFARPGIRCTAIAEDGLAGFLCDPGDDRQHPGVIVLGGSEGGLSTRDAAMLASRGLAALSLAYFGAKGLPRTLQNIPLEYFGKAIRWMRTRRGVDPDAIAMYGASRGAEAALLAAAVYPDIKAVVAKSPTHARWEGLTARRMPGGPAWTHGGKPLPYIPNRIGLRFAARYAWDTVVMNPIRTTPLFMENLAGSAAASDAEIPVEDIRGPVLLVSGKDDQVWPSALMAGRVIDRLRLKRHPYADEHLSYEGAGHWLPEAYLPTAGSRKRMKYAIGGTPEGAARAQADSWPRILRFLATHLAEHGGRR